MTDEEKKDLLAALSVIDPRSLNYQEWVNVGMSIKAAGGDWTIWDEWSQRDPERYHAGECETKWNSYQSTGITKNTLFKMAIERGYKPAWNGDGGELDWNDEINDDLVVVNKAWLETDEFREPSDKDWNPIDDIRRYLSALFNAEDSVGYVIDAYQDQEKKKWHPNRSGNYDRSAGQLLEELGHAKSVNDVFFDYNEEAGVWIRFNPLDGTGVKNSNVTEFRHALVESDDMSLSMQEAIIRKLELPVAALVYSGGKSVHAIVKIDAANYDEYRKRVDYLYKVCEKNGLSVDKQNKNPSRLSRAPGFRRGEHKQFLIGTNIGKSSWAEWEEWIEGVNDDLPDIEDLDREWNNMPDLAPELIEGVLRQGHKMLLAGPSKAGKSFLLIELAIAIAEGKRWLGRACTQGKVLYVNLELDRASCLHRLHDVYEAMDVTPAHLNNLKIWNLRGKTVPMDKLAPKLIRRCQKEKYIAVIIDPIYKVITGDENSAEQMSKFCNQFDKVATEMECAVIYCHHHSKGSQGGKRSMDRASGSGVFARDPDALLDLIELELDDATKEKNLKRLEIECAKKHSPAGTFRDLSPEDMTDHKKVMSAYWTMFRELGMERQAEDWLRPLKESAETMTAWRVDATLREFAKPSQTDIWFDYPTHYLDATRILKDVLPESEMTPQAVGHRRYTSGKAQKKRDQASIDTLEIAWSSVELEGRSEATVKELAERATLSEKTIMRYLKKPEAAKVFELIKEEGKPTIVTRKEPGAVGQI